MPISKKVTKKKTKRKLTGHVFKKGNKESVGIGRPKMTEEEKELSLKTRTDFKVMLDKYMITEPKQLTKLLKSKTIPAIDAMIIRSLLNAINSGDSTQINWFLNHSLGKEKETSNVHITGSMENSIDVKKLSKEELLALKVMAEKNNAKS